MKTTDAKSLEYSVGQKIPELDAEIYKITFPTKEEIKKGEEFIKVEIGMYESLGEIGGIILTRFYKTPPTLQEIKDELLDEYKEDKKEMNAGVTTYSIVSKTEIEEEKEAVIDKILANYK